MLQADRAHDFMQHGDALVEPGEFLGRDGVVLGIARIHISAPELLEEAAGAAGIARPGLDQAGIEALALPPQFLDVVKLRRVESEDKQRAMIGLLGRLVKEKGGWLQVFFADAEISGFAKVNGAWKPLVEIPLRFLMRHLRRERLRIDE